MTITSAAVAMPTPPGQTDAIPVPGWDAEVPLSWVRASREVPYGNLGDALSALVTGAISGLPVRHANFDQDSERLVAIGTVIQDQRKGTVHVWGSGIDGRINRENPGVGHYTPPAGLKLVVHAVRGPRTAAALRRVGVATPPVYGDPAWFLPRILPEAVLKPEKTHDLGVICHISELEALTASAGAAERFARYAIPPAMAGRVRVINTLIEPTLEGVIGKMREILSCRRVLSSSFHGLIVPLAYGIPSLTHGLGGDGFKMLNAGDEKGIDHRFGDFFAGVGLQRVPAICSERTRPTADWQALMDIIDANHVPVHWTGRDLFDAFPARKAVSFDDAVWPIPTALGNAFKY